MWAFVYALYQMVVRLGQIADNTSQIAANTGRLADTLDKFYTDITKPPPPEQVKMVLGGEDITQSGRPGFPPGFPGFPPGFPGFPTGGSSMATARSPKRSRFIPAAKAKGRAAPTSPPTIDPNEALVLQLVDANGNPVTPDPNTTTATVTFSDPSVATVVPDMATQPVSPLNFLVNLTGKAGSGTFTANVTTNGTTLPTCNSVPCQVPAGSPTTVNLTLGGEDITAPASGTPSGKP